MTTDNSKPKSKPAKQEVNGTVILPSLVFPAQIISSAGFAGQEVLIKMRQRLDGASWPPKYVIFKFNELKKLTNSGPKRLQFTYEAEAHKRGAGERDI